MLARQPENFLNRATQALNRPIQSRCAELTVLFDRGSMKDLHTIFPLLVDHIFGPHGTVCWDLRAVTSATNPQDFQALQHFLSPLGPMFRLIYTLLRDPLLKFEFSLSYLPSRVRQNIDASTTHPFYADLIHIDPQTNRIISLMLNPFDYYFFHFAYHLINPYHQRFQSPTGATWSTVYYVLCCDYVLHFLPTNPSCPVVPHLNFYNGKNPIYMLPAFHKAAKSSRLFRTDILNTSGIQTLEHHPRNEIWRSETIMTVFVDMWLNNDQVLSGGQGFDRNFGMSLSSCKQKLQMNDIPTGEYIRIVRVLVKQLHAFASSAKADDTHMGELKKIVIPYLQGRIYIFLRHLVHRWPLDGSFRLVLELWVSFLQPWRYPGNDYMKPINQPEVNPDLEDISTAPMKAVDREYLQFMAENLLAYTVILQQLLPRFIRVDLSSPKIALILYRLTKVFGQPNLVAYLREIESNAEFTKSSPVHSYSMNYSNSLPPLSPTSTWSTNTAQNYTSSYPNNAAGNSNFNNSTFYESICSPAGGKWASIIKQKILEYESPNFCYKPIFCAPAASEVHELMWHIKKAEETALSTIQLRLEEMKQQSQGFLGFIKSIFVFSESSNDEFSLEERKKVPTYLQNSLKNLSDIFRVTETNYVQQQPKDSVDKLPLQNDINTWLTPQRVRERVKNIKYEGDPELHPIRSDEVKVLVRLLYQLSLKINEDFGPQINNLYCMENFAGRLSRQVLSPPMTIYKYDKSLPGASPRVPVQLPPKLSLRYFASQKFLFYIILAIIISKMCGYGYLTLIYLIATIWFLYICLKSICDNRPSNFAAPIDNSMEIDYSANESF